MTKDEKIAAIKTARMIRTSRKARGWTQVETARKIGISQSALSKLESSQLIPSVHQWFEFCKHAAIPVGSHLLGYLDRLEPVTFHEVLPKQDFKISKIYTEGAGSTARSLFPLLRWAEQKVGSEKIDQLWETLGVDPDYFVELSNPINFRFYADLTTHLKESGYFKSSDLVKLTQPVSRSSSHGMLAQIYLKATDPESLVNTVFSRASFYEVNFKYQIEEISRKKVKFSVAPEDHMKDFKSLHFTECMDFLPEYRNQYFSNLFSSFHAGAQTRTKEISLATEGTSFHEITFSVK